MPESVRITNSTPASGSFALIHDSVPQGSLLFANDIPTGLQSQANLTYDDEPLTLVTLGEQMRMRREYKTFYHDLDDLSPDIFTPYVAGQQSGPPNDHSPRLPVGEAEVAPGSPANSLQTPSPPRIDPPALSAHER
ncbi:hypothetical protein CYLTODRAFT_191247 [Cylindrobasidium torrendii FP15055 ss-10]|uniref:Uncharacterized protein n=1 Tax=Cylindrobasidium torrendii FP15055 ss-10 TaxID=1314674 RepID=A0A0D7BU63_9AGAR|nr:hypothetical protein CYLTODRAFT_191247 [Cylindrobasidium torrendii FP15055 ss-10]